MDHILKSLRHRRDVVEARIEEERSRPAPDGTRLGTLKKLRLRFRDQIEFIERLNRDGQTVPIPVVRRRSFRPALARQKS